MHKRAYSESGAFYERTRPEDARTHKLESVVVRIKKLEENERPTLHADPKDKTILYFDKDFEIEQYNFDIVFDGDDDNEKVFLEIGGHTIVQNVCRGFKETVIAYGQTGSGKTYTLFGSNQELGIVHYFLHHLYTVKCNDHRKKTIYVSLYEVVGDKLIDLLTNVNDRNTQFYTQDYYLKTIRHSYKVVNISSFEMAKKIIDTACLMRNVEATSQNRRSSRSHAIIHLFVNTSDFTHHDGVETTRDYYGVLTFVDLVGCEREEFNTEGSQNNKEKTSTKFLNSSLTSLNKMLRKMQMGNLDESDKRQSVLCKVLFNYIKKTCGVCLIFCFNPRQCQKSLTSSTLIMASQCKKIKSKRKQVLYVKTENRDYPFKRITHKEYGKKEEGSGKRNGRSPLSGESYPRTSKRDSSKDTSMGKGTLVVEEAPSNGNTISNPIRNSVGTNPTMVIVQMDDVRDHENGTHVLTYRKGKDKHEALKKLVCELVHINKEEEKEKERMILNLQKDVDRLTKECFHWKMQAQNYHKKLILLHRNYAKIRELLFNTLHSGGNDVSIGTFRSSTSCCSFAQLDEDNSPLGGNIYAPKESKHVKEESVAWEKKQLTEKYNPVRQEEEVQKGGMPSYQKKHYGASSSKRSNQSSISKGMNSFIGLKEGKTLEHIAEHSDGGYFHHMDNGEHSEADTLERRRDNKQWNTQRHGGYSGMGESSTYTRLECKKVDSSEPSVVRLNSEQAIIKDNNSAKVVPIGGMQMEKKSDVPNANDITIDSLTRKIRNRILKSRSLSTAG
eukprot:XP_002257614.1 kinesin-like protein, putative [Plasmodium knowlesi strain H]